MNIITNFFTKECNLTIGYLSFSIQQATQCDEIARVLLANKKLPDHITGEEGWKDAKVMDGIYKAAATGGRVSL
jgi:predicted dehydrogenase